MGRIRLMAFTVREDTMKRAVQITFILLFAACSTAPKRTIVFVCEHGAARSVIAAAYFNRFAAERHLPYHAIARGTSPQEELSVATVKGLEADGIPFERAKPRPLTEADARDAARLMAFCPIPDKFARALKVEE